MARTKASVGAKISSGKSSKARCSAAPPTASTGASSGSSDKAARSSGSGNPVCPRETPKWQRPITSFFINKSNDSIEIDEEDNGTAGSSKPKRNIIQSSDEETSPEKPTNRELDETIELETLTGENSHKIQDYYSKESKGKGIGKKTTKKQSEKENLEETADKDSNTHCEKNNLPKHTENGVSETDNLEKDSNTDHEKNNHVENIENGASETENLKETIERDGHITNDIANVNDKENVDSNVSETENVDSKSDRDSNIKRSKRERDERQEESVSKKIKV